jgi:hypothetical protein
MNMLRKTWALVAVALILPVLAHAKDGGKKGEHEDNGKGGKSEQHEDNKGNNGHHGKVPVVPEANAGWVLLPFVGAVLLLSWRQLSRVKA